MGHVEIKKNDNNILFSIAENIETRVRPIITLLFLLQSSRCAQRAESTK